MLCLRGATRRYPGAAGPTLCGVDLDIAAGEAVAIMGPSGSGKTTLLNILGHLDRLDAGTYLMDGIDSSELGDDELSELRGRSVGFVFQHHLLLADRTVLANVVTPLSFADRATRRQGGCRAKALLEELGLGDRMGALPSELSGGQRQRVAIARALVGAPRCVLADEPSGALDGESAATVCDLLFGTATQHGATLVVVTHQAAVAERAHRTILFADGRLT